MTTRAIHKTKDSPYLGYAVPFAYTNVKRCNARKKQFYRDTLKQLKKREAFYAVTGVCPICKASRAEKLTQRACCKRCDIIAADGVMPVYANAAVKPGQETSLHSGEDGALLRKLSPRERKEKGVGLFIANGLVVLGKNTDKYLEGAHAEAKSR